MNVIGYTSSGSIELQVNGARMFVPDDPDNMDRQQIAEWEAAGNTIPPYVPPVQSLPPVALVTVAGVRLTVDQDAWEVSGVDRSTDISGAFLADIDTVYVFFNTPQADTDYEVIPSTATGITKHTDYVEVTRPGLTEAVFIVQRVQ